MQGAGDEILTDTALPADQDDRVDVGNARDDGADLAHPGMAVEERQVIDEVFHILLRRRSITCLDLPRAHENPPDFRCFRRSHTFGSIRESEYATT